MTDKKSATADIAVEKELEGVPEHMKDETPEATDTADAKIAALEEAIAAAQQDVLYAQAETQNVRRRMEKEAQDARAYAATGFARDVLSVSDNLSRALEAIPAEMRDSEAMKPLVIGLEATGRELDSVFTKNGITRIAAMGMPLDPNQHQAMVEIPSADAAPGTIIAEMQAGYMIKDRLLRPALVGVAKAVE
ncbi:nucleotide exchange factor GrpE [Sphingorhabdus sp.]|jgi:molecular chaperone GrpE|uniref:nucleotide exchange factor GrpE n=3 Tax=Sphingorhabdus sp. TaxID=1902408 RepID=UPI0027400421|nr:nucleotide exchange factor GrpE [Sphingorhabdus sp.]MCX7267443.1 nucleotide exchange factor GrpE [Sphingomonadales bacterium]MDP4927951.1 nucleotide exchange factor GrpE [Sphingorhabdus sp.]